VAPAQLQLDAAGFLQRALDAAGAGAYLFEAGGIVRYLDVADSSFPRLLGGLAFANAQTEITGASRPSPQD